MQETIKANLDTAAAVSKEYFDRKARKRTQFGTDRQKKNKDPVVKAIHFDVYRVYNAPALFPHDSLDAAEIDHLAESVIAAFHNVTLSD
uniref:Uncharacterized protein n=1 Tax=Romanomermis culicivorax TaxID=13658 RepID=A0A915J399_ROMCU